MKMCSQGHYCGQLGHLLRPPKKSTEELAVPPQREEGVFSMQFGGSSESMPGSKGAPNSPACQRGGSSVIPQIPSVSAGSSESWSRSIF